MRRRSGIFRFLLCLSAWILWPSRYCRAEGITEFTQRYVTVNVDGEEIIEVSANGVAKNYGICPYVDVFLAGELNGSADRLEPEDGFLCGSCSAEEYFRFGVGSGTAGKTIPRAEEESVMSWNILMMSSKPFMATRYVRVRDRQMTSLFDGNAFRLGFQVFFQNQPKYITSGLVQRVSGYAGTDSKESFTVYEDWFRARYNHNYEICYDYGFVNAASRGLSSEQGTIRENLSYFTIPKQLTDPAGDDRYSFLGWRVSGDGGTYTPAQGSDKASFRYGQPEQNPAVAANLSLLAMANYEEAAATEMATASEISGERALEEKEVRSSVEVNALRSTASELARTIE